MALAGDKQLGASRCAASRLCSVRGWVGMRISPPFNPKRSQPPCSRAPPCRPPAAAELLGAARRGPAAPGRTGRAGGEGQSTGLKGRGDRHWGYLLFASNKHHFQLINCGRT